MSRIVASTLLAFAVGTAALSAQGPSAGAGTRFGVSVGGISTVGLVVEFFDDAHSVEFAAGTWSFRDLGLSVVGKQYFGAGAAKPFVGAGLWVVTARPAQERRGLALVLRAPIGVDWAIADEHALGGALNVNRALVVRRSDPDDDIPMSARFVPLPELYYRLTR